MMRRPAAVVQGAGPVAGGSLAPDSCVSAGSSAPYHYLHALRARSIDESFRFRGHGAGSPVPLRRLALHPHTEQIRVTLQQAAQQLRIDTRIPGDTMTVFHPPRDITPVERVFRWFFSVPQWVQLSGAALALIVAVVAVIILVREWRQVVRWVRTRDMTTPVFWKIVIGLAAAGVLFSMAGSGAAFFVYSQDSNQFCLSCHTLHDEVYERFQQSKHHQIAQLRCHDCHDEPVVAEMTQVVRWMLLRPADVGPHAPVPRAVCANCHVQRNADSTWQRIVATAGHSIHVLSDTAAKLHIECLTCHGVSAHRFVPASTTCQQSGCHDKLTIQLGLMANQTTLHCVACHPFTAPITETRQVAAASNALVPTSVNCLGCHAMRERLARFVPSNDPHKGRCGDCHDPHKQTTPAAAFGSCATAGCHARPDTLTPFHQGVHSRVLSSCGRCHSAHTWTLRGATCLSCHQKILDQPGRVFRRDTAQAMLTPQPPFRFAMTPGRAPGPAAPEVALQAAGGQTAQDTTKFSHNTHRALQCVLCHAASGALQVRSVRDCLSCHHQREVQAGSGAAACERCHPSAHCRGTLTQTVTVTTTTAPEGVSQELPFSHERHSLVELHGLPHRPGDLTLRALVLELSHAAPRAGARMPCLPHRRHGRAHGQTGARRLRRQRLPQRPRRAGAVFRAQRLPRLPRRPLQAQGRR